MAATETAVSGTDIFAFSTCIFVIVTFLHVKVLIVSNVRHSDNEFVIVFPVGRVKAYSTKSTLCYRAQ